jgi:hypothetical protein
LFGGPRYRNFGLVLRQSQRPIRDEDRRVVDQYRQRDVGTVAFEPKYSFLGGAAGLVIGFAWFTALHFGDLGASSWPIFALTAACAALGLPVDLRRRRVRLRERRAAAASRWDFVESVGVVDCIVAEAARAVRIDDNQANTAWFLQVEADQILCVWDWVGEATEHVEVDLIPAASPNPLAIRWSGKKLAPIHPKRKFKRGEGVPAQCEVLLAEGGVADLLDYLGPALKTEGCELPAITQTYDARQGYTLMIGDEPHTMWNESEANRSWELTTTRTAALINRKLEIVGSQESVHLLSGGEDGVFVLLTARMRDVLASSGVFRPEEVPGHEFVRDPR